MQKSHDAYQDIRDAVRALCAEFPDEYHRKVDEARGLPITIRNRSALLCNHACRPKKAREHGSSSFRIDVRASLRCRSRCAPLAPFPFAPLCWSTSLR